MRCKTCGNEVVCPNGHTEDNITEFQHDMDGSWYYSCGKCIEEGAGAFGSIIHWCNDAFGMFSGKGCNIVYVDIEISCESKLNKKQEK